MSTKMPVLLIDGDIINYRIASACEGARWNYRGTFFKSKVKANEATIQGGGSPEDLIYQPKPESKKVVVKTLDKYIESMVEPFLFYFPEFYIGSSGNFRHGVATIKKYKGNRVGIVKPVHFQLVHDLLCEEYCATIAHERLETDDELARRHKKDGSTVLCSLDKDFLQLEGMNYNPNSRECKYISPLAALQYFYSQVLTGDTADNIPGLFGVGEKSTLIKKLWAMDSEHDLFTYCLDRYKDRFGSYAEQFMLENIKLLYLVRKQGAYWKDYFSIGHNYWKEGGYDA